MTLKNQSCSWLYIKLPNMLWNRWQKRGTMKIQFWALKLIKPGSSPSLIVCCTWPPLTHAIKWNLTETSVSVWMWCTCWATVISCVHQDAILSGSPPPQDCWWHSSQGETVHFSVTYSMGSNLISNKEAVDVCHTAGLSLIIICNLAVVWLTLRPDRWPEGSQRQDQVR